MYNHYAKVQSNLKKIFEPEYKQKWFQYILDNPQLSWDNDEISGNPLVTIITVLQNPQFPWNFNRLSSNPSITLANIMANPQLSWNWNYVSTSPNVYFDDILNYPNNPWNLLWFCQYNSNRYIIPKSQIFAHLELPWDTFSLLSGGYKITVQDVLDHPDLNWDWANLCASRNFTLTEILEHFPEQADFTHISRNPTITMADILAHPEIQWDFSVYSANPQLRFQDVLQNPQFNWNYTIVSLYCSFTVQDILTNPHFQWDWSYITQKPTINFQDIIKYPFLPWKYDKIYENPNITIEYVLAHPDILWNYIRAQSIDMSAPLSAEDFTINEFINEPERSKQLVLQNLNIFGKLQINTRSKCLFRKLQKNTRSHSVITVEDALKYPQIPASKVNLFSNDESVSFETVAKYSDRFLWNYRELSINKQREAMTKYVQERLNHCTKVFEMEERLVQIAMHPNKIRKFLAMGYEIMDLEHIL